MQTEEARNTALSLWIYDTPSNTLEHKMNMYYYIYEIHLNFDYLHWIKFKCSLMKIVINSMDKNAI